MQQNFLFQKKMGFLIEDALSAFWEKVTRVKNDKIIDWQTYTISPIQTKK